MELVVSHMSALDFWRFEYPADKRPSNPPRMPNFNGKIAVNESDVWTLAPKWVTPAFLEPENGVLHVLSFSNSDRRVSRTHVTHQWSGSIPDGAFYSFGDGTHVCSPGFAFLQMASSLNLYELIALGYELCGTYAFDPSADRGFRKRLAPLVTLEQLEQFLLGAQGSYGQAKALHALQFVIAGAASPRETLTALLLTLPRRHGGYGLPPMQLNHRVDLETHERRLCGKSFLRVDLCYPSQKLAIEYLGEYDHGKPSAFHSDRSRTNVLAGKGYDVIELTSMQVDSVMSFDVVALEIAKRLRQRVRKEHRGANPKRMELREKLFRWNANRGRSVCS